MITQLLTPDNLPPGAFYIKGQVPSSKNSKQIFCKDAQGKCLKTPRLVDSELTQAYVSNTFSQWLSNAGAFQKAAKNLPKPLHIEFTFIRETNGIWDFTGPLETVLDCMSGLKFQGIKGMPLNAGKLAKWIEDDSVRFILPYPGQWYVDKLNAGVIIRIL